MTVTSKLGIPDGGVNAAALAATAVTPGPYTAANITVDQQGRITAAASGVSGITTVLSVKQSPYNAVGDGVTDDATAISSAIAAAIAANVPCYFPSGTYLIGSTITITGSNVVLAGVGRGATIKFSSSARAGLTLASTDRNVDIHDLFFQGNAADDNLNTNFYAAILVSDDVTDMHVHHCTFDHCTPLDVNDSFKTRRLHFYKNYVHNAPNGVHPPSDSTIEDCDFVCDAIVTTRAQAIYSFGQQTNLTIDNCRFKNIAAEDIQIRASTSRFNERDNFRITNCHFENSYSYSIWAGSDSKPDIGEFIIGSNTFKNCRSPINLDGARSAVIHDNHAEWNWENPLALTGGSFISAVSGIGLSGQYNNSRGVVITGNKAIHRHPWMGKVTIDTVPANNDTLTVADFVYTWKTSPTVEGHIQIGADTTISASNLLLTLRGLDGLMTAPNNALRYLTDVFNNPFAASYGETNFNVVIIASWYTFTLSKSSSHMTLTAPVDLRAACDNGIQAVGLIAPLIADNHFDDFTHAVLLTKCWSPTVRNNILTDHGLGVAQLITATANVHSHYSGNRVLQQNPLPLVNRQYHSFISDGFPVIEDTHVLPQQLTTPDLGGRQGVVKIGDGNAYMYFWYGSEIASPLDASTLPFRFEDGDWLRGLDFIVNPIWTFKRSSPGAGQFNSADSLITLINASANFTAAYADYQDDLSSGNPKLMIKIKAVAATAGVAGNSSRFYSRRYKTPTDGATYATVPQQLTVAQILRDGSAANEYALFYGGAATLIKTFVQCPIANASNGVMVQGIDAASHALDPVVYQADIVDGVGFTITHAADNTSGAAKFFWRAS